MYRCFVVLNIYVSVSYYFAATYAEETQTEKLFVALKTYLENLTFVSTNNT